MFSIIYYIFNFTHNSLNFISWTFDYDNIIGNWHINMFFTFGISRSFCCTSSRFGPGASVAVSSGRE